MINDKTVKVVVFEIVCAIYRIVLSVHKLNKLGKFWLIYVWTIANISYHVMADMKKVYDDLIIINLYARYYKPRLVYSLLHFSLRFIL